jgi:hypothetical protein
MGSINPCTQKKTSSQSIYIENSKQAPELTHKHIVIANCFKFAPLPLDFIKRFNNV